MNKSKKKMIMLKKDLTECKCEKPAVTVCNIIVIILC